MFGKYNLVVNTEKTEVIVISSCREDLNIIFDEYRIEQVEAFKISDRGMNEDDIGN